MIERRRWPRQQVAWFVKLLVGESDVIAGTAHDASRHGVRLTVDADVEATGIRHGDRCRLQVRLPNSEAIFFREAEVRYVGAQGIGLAITETLPAAVISPCSNVSMSAADTVSSKRSSHPAPTLRTLCSIAFALFRA